MIHPMTFTFQSRIGLGTWKMGEAARSESDEVKAFGTLNHVWAPVGVI